MDLRQVAAVGAQLLPDVRHRVDAEDLDTEIGQVQQTGHHSDEDLGIAVVEVPLERVELGHDPFAHLLVPREVAGGGGREDLRDDGVILVGDGALVIAEVVVLVFGVAGLCGFRPPVGGRGVVHDEIKAQADAGFAQFRGEVGEVLIGADSRVDGVEILDGVAAVVVGVGHGQQRHEVQVGQMLLLEIVDMLGEIGEFAGGQVGVHGHAEHVAATVPLRIVFTGGVEAFEVGWPVGVRLSHDLFEMVEFRGIPVQRAEKLFKFCAARGEPFGEYGIAICGFHVKLLCLIRQACTFSPEVAPVYQTGSIPTMRRSGLPAITSNPHIECAGIGAAPSRIQLNVLRPVSDQYGNR